MLLIWTVGASLYRLDPPNHSTPCSATFKHADAYITGTFLGKRFRLYVALNNEKSDLRVASRRRQYIKHTIDDSGSVYTGRDARGRNTEGVGEYQSDGLSLGRGPARRARSTDMSWSDENYWITKIPQKRNASITVELLLQCR